MPVVLLIEDAEGELVAVKFDSLEEARNWEDAHQPHLVVRGVARCLTRAGALLAATSPLAGRDSGSDVVGDLHLGLPC